VHCTLCNSSHGGILPVPFHNYDCREGIARYICAKVQEFKIDTEDESPILTESITLKTESTKIKPWDSKTDA